MAYISFQPSDHFNTKLYTGTDVSNPITGVGFQPDWVWIKKRSGSASSAIMDAVRGNDKSLRSNTTGAEYTNTYFTSFDSDGFTVATSENDVNAGNGTYVSWNWKANGSGSSNTDGTITSTVSANTTAGFSICTYTGDGGASSTFGHGLGAKPDMIFYKQRSGTENWLVTTDVVDGSHDFGYLNTAAAFSAAGSAVPTSSVVNLTASGLYNNNGSTYVAYCFASKKGFSKFGSYTGNGNADGTFIYTGFRPAFSIIKRTSGTYNWPLRDNKRETFNPSVKELYTDAADAELTSASNIDFLSNGFKIRNTSGTWNGSGSTYVYMVFAENPIVSSNDIPGVAR